MSPTDGSPKRMPMRFTSTRWPMSSVGSIEPLGMRYVLTSTSCTTNAISSAATTIVTISTSGLRFSRARAALGHRRTVAVRGAGVPVPHAAYTVASPWRTLPRSSCSPRRAATAPASTGPCRRSSARSTCTARPSTCARRSCTTSTSSSSCARAARSSSTRRPRCRRARPSSSPPTASRRACTRTPPRAACRRSTRPARSSRRSTSRRRDSPPRATRSCSSATKATRRSRARWGRRPTQIVLIETEEDVDALEVEDPERVAYISQTTLSVDETRAIILRAAREVPGDRRSAHRRHLLRHDEPPGGRQAAGAGVRPRARDRLAELVELEPARRRHARARHRRAPDRPRGPGRRRRGWRAARRRHHVAARARRRSSCSGSSRSSARAAPSDVEELEVIQEDVRFMLPKTIRQAMAAADLTPPERRSSSPTCTSARARGADLLRRAGAARAAARGAARRDRAARAARRRARAAPGAAARGARGGAAVLRRGRRGARRRRRDRARAGQPRPRARRAVARAPPPRRRAAAARARPRRRVGAGDAVAALAEAAAPARLDARLPGRVAARRRLRDARPLPRPPHHRADARAPRAPARWAGSSGRCRERGARPTTTRRALAPIYAWSTRSRSTPTTRRPARTASRCARGARSSGNGHRPLRRRALVALLPARRRGAQPRRPRAGARRRLRRRAAARAGVRAMGEAVAAARDRRRARAVRPHAPRRPAPGRRRPPSGRRRAACGCTTAAAGSTSASFLSAHAVREPVLAGHRVRVDDERPAARCCALLERPRRAPSCDRRRRRSAGEAGREAGGVARHARRRPRSSSTPAVWRSCSISG